MYYLSGVDFRILEHMGQGTSFVPYSHSLLIDQNIITSHRLYVDLLASQLRQNLIVAHIYWDRVATRDPIGRASTQIPLITKSISNEMLVTNHKA